MIDPIDHDNAERNSHSDIGMYTSQPASKAEDLLTYVSSQKFNSMVSLWQGDITKLNLDCIVNSIHGDEVYSDYSHLTESPDTVADCIYKAGGRQLLIDLCKKLNKSSIKQLIVTDGHLLPAKSE